MHHLQCRFHIDSDTTACLELFITTVWALEFWQEGRTHLVTLELRRSACVAQPENTHAECSLPVQDLQAIEFHPAEMGFPQPC